MTGPRAAALAALLDAASEELAPGYVTPETRMTPRWKKTQAALRVIHEAVRELRQYATEHGVEYPS